MILDRVPLGLGRSQGRILFVLALAIFPAAMNAQVPVKSAQQQFDRGKGLIEANCVDCMSSTMKGMDEGIREVLSALQSGFKNQLAAYRLLSDGYGAMAVYTEKSEPKESREYWIKRAGAMKKLYSLAPDDPEIAEEYVYTLSNDAEKISILRGILLKHPNYSPAGFLLGLMLIHSKDFSEGLKFVTDAIANSKILEDEANYVDRLMEALNDLGCPVPDEGNWMEQGNAALEADLKATTEPAAFQEFKKKFLASLEGFECKQAAAEPRQPLAVESGK